MSKSFGDMASSFITKPEPEKEQAAKVAAVPTKTKPKKLKSF